MSTKEEKPTLAGVTVKTRKRNIVVPVDPGSFADAVVQIVQDASDGVSVEEDLEAATKALDTAELEFQRYGDTLFEVMFAGGRLATGGNLADDHGKKLDKNILACEPNRDAIAPYIKMFGTLARRRPFLIRGLENTLIKLLLSLEFFSDDNRRKLGIAMALVFSNKIAVVQENIFAALLNDRLVSKGTVLDVLTVFLQEFLAKDSMDDLVTNLTKGKVVNRLLDFFPPSKRNQEDFVQHFTAAKLTALVEWNAKREEEVKIDELQNAISDAIAADPPTPVAEVLALIKAKKAENDLPDTEVLRVMWMSLMKSINMTGKNQQQIMQSIKAKIKTYHKLLAAYATSAKLELSLLVTIQVLCYEDNRMLKLFSDIVRILYDGDIIGEDTIHHWYKKGSHPKGRNVFLKDIEPFIKWLEEAEEEEEGDD
mmetsp:Transcript_1455/g.3202  ORF Transcript_1455/g.3202 Transcript_1455/m.3202 type:complete len:425 (-) Transcript_1455:625-1899(-)|eukprot:CAMPEP_0202895538 /NCGR_PEP_ID=MMETSP1392-20130828/4712_1 /ASSEMBLY_ACC=CAM_ASM_000868 /TAXON_ID=225041 /ORGANISM="Chlamydomonas chlamydogama, Strain SAG 11-48b" /LENGTH=424 /DNA_ID=CAMNT_0049580573 /DNA_START=108 /DNA_END=1382 /DNA_ORIENTATION=-